MFWQKKPKIEQRTVRWDIDVEGFVEGGDAVEFVVKRYFWKGSWGWDLERFWSGFDTREQAEAFIVQHQDYPISFTVEHTLKGGA